MPSEPLPDESENPARQWEESTALARRFASQNELEQAELHSLNALEVAESFPADDRRQGITLELLTGIYFRKQQYPICAPFLIRLLEMYKRCLGPNHVDTATIHHNVAMLYQNWGKPLQACKFLVEAIRIKSNSLGRNHPDVEKLCAEYAKLQAGESVKQSGSRSALRQNLTATSQVRRIEKVFGKKLEDPNIMKELMQED